MTQDIDFKALIRTVPNFPKPGVLFRDITTLLKHADGFSAVIEKLGAAYCEYPIDKIAAIESRGFIIGAALAYKLNVGFVAKRGLEPDKWFNNVELVVAEKIGQETTTYVRNIYKYYVSYKLTLEAQETRRKTVEALNADRAK